MRWAGDRGGHPSRCTPALVELMCRQMIESGMTRCKIFRLHGLHRSTSWRWANRHPWVARAWRIAEIRRRERLEDRRVDRRLNRPLHADPERNGRPSTWRPEYANRVRSSSVRALARQIRRPRSTVRSWARKYPELRRALLREAVREAGQEIDALVYENQPPAWR